MVGRGATAYGLVIVNLNRVLNFNANDELARRVQALLQRVPDIVKEVMHQEPSRLRRGHWFSLTTRNLTEVDFNSICDELRTIGVDFSVVETIDYSPKEWAAAPACFLGCCYAPTGEIPQNRWEEVFDTRTGCPRCWTGAIQNQDLLLVGFSPRAGQLLAVTQDQHFLVHASLRRELAPAMSPESFRPIRSDYDHVVEWMQLCPTSALLPMHASTRGVVIGRESSDAQCPVCKQDGFYRTPQEAFRPVYERLELGENACAATFERWGASNRVAAGRLVQRVAPPNLCLPQRIVKLLLKHAKKYVGFDPVTVLRPT